MNLGLSQNEIRLNTEMENDINELALTNPLVTIARNLFVAKIRENPPEIQLTSYKKKIKQSKLLQHYIIIYYVPVMESMYDWIKMYGVFPYKKRKIPNTNMWRPWIPPLKSGYIKTFLNKSHEQHYRWYWNGELTGNQFGGSHIKHDSSMRFGWKDEKSRPGVDGMFHSDIASLIKDYKTERIVREATEIGSYHGARPQHVMEHHPPKYNGGDDNLTTLETFGEEITGEVQFMQEKLRKEKFQVRTSTLQENIMYSIMRNKGYDKLFGRQSGMVNSESSRDQFERESAMQLDRAIPLAPDYTYKAVQMPKISVDMVKISSRFDELIASVMDFPLKMIQGSTGNSRANFQGQNMVLMDRLENWISFYKRELKKIFIEMNYGILTEGFEQVNAARIQRLDADFMYPENEIEIIIPIKSMASYAEMRQMFDDYIISHETFAKHAGLITGVPEEKLLLNPSMTPDEILPVKKRKSGIEGENIYKDTSL